jgi:hypothetical protein
MDFRIYVILVVSIFSVTLVTTISVEQRVNAALATTTTTKSATTTTPNGNNINCQSKNGSTNTQTSLGTLRFAAGKCTGENGGTVAAGGITSKPSTPTTSSENTNNINCQSNKELRIQLILVH